LFDSVSSFARFEPFARHFSYIFIPILINTQKIAIRIKTKSAQIFWSNKSVDG
jgi:hypothetical protein